MTISYKNPFYNIHYMGSRAIIETDAKPIPYKGYLIYERNPYAPIFDIVKKGVCVGMYAGLNGAKRAIDVKAV